MTNTMNRRAALARLATAVALTVPAVATAAPAAVATLGASASGGAPLTLDEEFEAAWARESAAWTVAGDGDGDDPNSEVSKAMKASSDIVLRILASPTRDLGDCKLKARAYLWCSSGDVESALEQLSHKDNPTDKKLLHALMRDLLALAGKT